MRLARSSSFRTSWALLGDFLGDGVDERVQVDAFVFLKALANSGEMAVETVAEAALLLSGRHLVRRLLPFRTRQRQAHNLMGFALQRANANQDGS